MFWAILLIRPCIPEASPNAVPPIVNPADKPAVTGASIRPDMKWHLKLFGLKFYKVICISMIK